MMDAAELEAVIEAILFVASDPVPRAKLLETFGEDEKPAAELALQAVIDRYTESAEASNRGIVIDDVAGGLRLVTRPDLHSHLRRFFEVSGTNRLTMASLETLAIIAYRQPITGPEISELRGVSASGVLKKLLERRLVRIAGRKEVVGKPFLYATTREFLMHFGLRSLKELPPLEQFEELFGSDAEGLPEPATPDVSEQAAQEAAALDVKDDEAFEKAEREQIEEERHEAEEEARLDDSGPEEPREPEEPAAELLAHPEEEEEPEIFGGESAFQIEAEDPSAVVPSDEAEPASEDLEEGPDTPSGDGEEEENGN